MHHQLIFQNFQSMRFYSLVNYYLSDLQRGLQTAHAVSEMLVDPKNCKAKLQHYHQWAKDHKTIIILNGGNSKMLQESYDNLSIWCTAAGLPITKFHEDEQSLNCALTCVGLVLPEEIYGAKRASNDFISHYEFRNADGIWMKNYYPAEPAYQILEILNKFKLA
jgi:hypothetical protein